MESAELVNETIEKYHRIGEEKGVRIDTAIMDNVKVRGDAALLKQVVSNLLLNAIKFNTPSGTVKVTLTQRELSIRDTGIGISAEDLPNIFQRFFQAENSRAKEGFGLGLALSRRIIELHGWSIRVESTLGKGTTFRVAIHTA